MVRVPNDTIGMYSSAVVLIIWNFPKFETRVNAHLGVYDLLHEIVKLLNGRNGPTQFPYSDTLRIWFTYVDSALLLSKYAYGIGYYVNVSVN